MKTSMKSIKRKVVTLGLATLLTISLSSISLAQNDVNVESKDEVVSATSLLTSNAGEVSTRASLGHVTTTGNKSTGNAYCKTQTYAGKADQMTAKVSTYYTGGVGPSSLTTTGKNVESVTSNSVSCSTTKGRYAIGTGTIKHGTLSQNAKAELSY